jgi:peptidyl-dipeptidase Dcp
MNPLLKEFNSPFGAAPFNEVLPEHFLPALKEAIKLGKKNIENIKNSSEEASFSNVCEELDKSGEAVSKVARIFFNLHSCHSNDEVRDIAKDFSPLLTEYSNDIALDEDLFEKIKTVYQQIDQLDLTVEQRRLLDSQYKDFSRNGALLNAEDKGKLRDIDKSLADLSLKFGDNVLEETNSFVMLIDNQNDLKGLPESTIEQAQATAKEKGEEGKWAFTLQAPSFMPFLKYAENRDLREKLYKAFTSRAHHADERDNSDNIKNISRLRFERANLLGYKTHAHFVLEERMAETPEQVESFLQDFLEKAKPVATSEIEKLKEYAQESGGPKKEDFQKWDSSFWSEKLRNDLFNFSEEELRPYFKLENVVDGAFQLANKLYGLNFKLRDDIPLYHPDVSAYEVLDEDGTHLSLFYADFFPRESKRSGAWMTSYKDQHIENGVDHRPHISIVCNFSKPTDTKPSLLTFNEVTTLFHEFGHALHGMLARTNYQSLSGTNVYWDFVELPSQILENWAFEKDCLDLFAKHYETGESIPMDLIKKIKASSNFQEGSMTLRQISFGLLDMSWHGHDTTSVDDVSVYEEKAISSCSLLPAVAGSNQSSSFSHIFQGGYSAGYYSYKWAEVLDADAFEAFKEKGIFDKEVATSFRKNVLERGGSEHPKELYLKFRGKNATPDALLKRAGLI